MEGPQGQEGIAPEAPAGPTASEPGAADPVSPNEPELGVSSSPVDRSGKITRKSRRAALLKARALEKAARAQEACVELITS